MLLTPNYSLKKPEGTDVVDISNFNDNSDIIDAKIKLIDTSLSETTQSIAQLSNPNLLINGDFQNPVNQRGLTTYNTHGKYTIDRWQFFTGGSTGYVTINDKFITLTNLVADNTYLQQKFDTNFSALNNSKVTITIKYRTQLNGVTLTAFGKTYLLPKSDNWIIKSFVIDISSWSYVLGDNTSSIFVQLYNGTNFVIGSLDMKYIKVESSSISTPFMPRFYGEELALCQRYYETLSYYGRVASGMSELLTSIPFKVTKRITPSNVDLGSNVYETGIGWISKQAEVSAYLNTKCCHFKIGSNTTIIDVQVFIGSDSEIY